MRTWLSRLLDLVLSWRRDARIDEEIATHLAELQAEQERLGLTPGDAALAARRRFGGVDQVKAHVRDVRGWGWFESLVQDVRFACRYLVRHRSFSVPLVAVLALGIGVGHMFFTLTYAHTMRGLPIEEVGRVLVVSTVDAQGADRPLSYDDFDDLRASQRTFEDLAAWTVAPFTLNVVDQVPDRLDGAFTTASGFAAARVRPLLGRLFAKDDERPGAPTTVVIAERLWRGRFAADAGLLGREVLVNGSAATVIGVISDKSGFPSAATVFLPLSVRPGPDATSPAVRPLRVFGRLAAGVTPFAAQADLDAMARTIAAGRPDTNAGVRFLATAINERFIGGRVGGWLPFITAGLIVIAVASTNAGNLVLAGAVARAREVAIRTSLGAARGRIIRQLLIESLLFAMVAAAIGLTLSRLGVALFSSAIPPETMPYWFDYSLDSTVLVTLWLIMLAMIAVFAIVPAWQSSRAAAVDVLKDGGRSDTARGSRFGASVFLAIQLGLATVLVTQVGVAVVDRNERLTTDALLEDSRVLTGGVAIPSDRYPAPEQRRQYLQRVEDRVRAVSTVVDLAFASAGPLEGSPERELLVEGRDSAASSSRVHVLDVSPSYFGVLGTGVLRGRGFDERDGLAVDRVALVNERLAALHFQGGEPLGQRIALRTRGDASAPVWATVVGVVPDIRHREGVPVAVPIAYVPLGAASPSNVTLFVRSAVDAASQTPQVREALRLVDPAVPLYRPRSLPIAVRDGTWVGRSSARLANTVSLAAFAMAAFGLFAVVTHRMLLRRREIGLRMALGADPRRIAAVVVGSVGRALVAGLVLGVMGVVAWNRSFAAGPAEQHVGFNLASALTALAATVILGCLLPTLRALRIDPAAALRRG